MTPSSRNRSIGSGFVFGFRGSRMSVTNSGRPLGHADSCVVGLAGPPVHRYLQSLMHVVVCPVGSRCERDQLEVARVPRVDDVDAGDAVSLAVVPANERGSRAMKTSLRLRSTSMSSFCQNVESGGVVVGPVVEVRRRIARQPQRLVVEAVELARAPRAGQVVADQAEAARRDHDVALVPAAPRALLAALPLPPRSVLQEVERRGVLRFREAGDQLQVLLRARQAAGPARRGRGGRYHQ